jgi:hypothetical protein
MTGVRRAGTLWLHLAALWAFAVSQPLFDLLGKNPEFFVAHQAGRTEIFLIVLGVALLPPTALLAVVGLARLAGRGAETAVLGAIVAALAGMFAMQVAKRAGAHTWPAAVPAAAAAGIAVALAYARAASFRRFVTLLSLGVVAFPMLLLARPEIRRLWAPPEDQSDRLAREAERAMKPANAAPVVMVVLDETPLLSWLDADAKIDPVLYPNLAALARDGTWFRNATAVSDYTRWAMPPIVSGQYPRPDASPAFADYPDTLFTLLGRTHRLEVAEAVSGLCPARLCRPPTDPMSARLALMTSDLRYVYLHVVLTDDLKHGLPRLTDRWADFGDLGAERRRRMRAVGRGISPRQAAENFIDWISADDPQPTFYFLDTLLTHFPHRSLPSGQVNGTRAAVPGEIPGEAWSDEPWGLAQNYQRHLLQIAYADRFVGRLVARLKAVGLYERAIVVVTADHGISFQPGTPRRAFTEQTAAAIMRVPLVIKLPAGRPGPAGPVTLLDGERVSDRNVEAVDIAPTVAAAMGIELPWAADGASLLDPSVPDRPSKHFFRSGRPLPPIDRRGPDPGPLLQRKLALFDGSDNVYRVPRPPRFGELVGRPLAELRVVDGGATVEVDFLDAFANVDTGADPVVFDVGGRLGEANPDGSPTYVAVAVNGTVRAVTRTWATEPRGWLATPSLDAWHDGRNDVQVFVVETDTRGPVLKRLACVPGAR